jgi:hypothetical protein
MQKIDPKKRFRKCAFSYPPELAETIAGLQKGRRLSNEISLMLAEKYNVKLS